MFRPRREVLSTVLVVNASPSRDDSLSVFCFVLLLVSCWEQIDTSEIGFMVESESTCTKEAMRNVVREVSRLEEEEIRDEEDDDSDTPQSYHFTLIRCATR